MGMPRRVSFGIKTAQHWTTYEDVLRVWQEADHLPLVEHAWLFDHFIPQGEDSTGPCLEGWTLLSALATQTRRLRLGIMVTGNTYRYPAVLAKMAATVDRISNGRLDFGIGAAWNNAEHVMYDIPLPTPKERIERLDEACELISRLWTEFNSHVQWALLSAPGRLLRAETGPAPTSSVRYRWRWRAVDTRSRRAPCGHLEHHPQVSRGI